LALIDNVILIDGSRVIERVAAYAMSSYV